MSFLRVLLLTLILSNITLQAEPPVTMRVSGRLGMAPHTFAATVVLERHVSNRELCLLWGLSGEGVYSSSCAELHGAQTQRVYYFQRTVEESGTWHVIARIQRADDTTHQDTAEITVIGGM